MGEEEAARDNLSLVHNYQINEKLEVQLGGSGGVSSQVSPSTTSFLSADG